jgi:hypothetical protein
VYLRWGSLDSVLKSVVDLLKPVVKVLDDVQIVAGIILSSFLVSSQRDTAIANCLGGNQVKLLRQFSVIYEFYIQIMEFDVNKNVAPRKAGDKVSMI